MVEHFRTRLDMINWLIANCPRPALVRAIKANRIEFLGGFSKIPPSDLPGWIFKVKLLSGEIKNVCILANDKKLRYEIRLTKNISWKNWCGVFHGVLMKHSIQSGDNPLQYKELYNAEKNNR
jgi:hypothetical protein